MVYVVFWYSCYWLMTTCEINGWYKQVFETIQKFNIQEPDSHFHVSNEVLATSHGMEISNSITSVHCTCTTYWLNMNNKYRIINMYIHYMTTRYITDIYYTTVQYIYFHSHPRTPRQIRTVPPRYNFRDKGFRTLRLFQYFLGSRNEVLGCCVQFPHCGLWF